VEDRAAEGPYGAKGVGEITSIPTAPAILNAIYNATGVRLYDLPATPDRIKQALAKGIGKSGTRESGSGESGNREISDRGRPDSLIS
jgi:hypothetical protein